MAKELFTYSPQQPVILLRVRDALTKSEAMIGYSTRMIQESNFILAEIKVSATDQLLPAAYKLNTAVEEGCLLIGLGVVRL